MVLMETNWLNSPIQQVFELLWCLVCHDIWFVWERSEFLQQAEGQMLTSKPFSVSITQ